MSSADPLSSEPHPLVACSGCGGQYPTYDAYLTTREHPIGADKWLCSYCAVEHLSTGRDSA